MDPNTLLRWIELELNFVTANPSESSLTVDGFVCDFATWIDNGGFAPDWSAYPLATSYYNTRCAQANRVDC
jgi:hypothetical protein